MKKIILVTFLVFSALAYLGFTKFVFASPYDDRYLITRTVICANSIRRISKYPPAYSGNIRYRYVVQNFSNESREVGVAYFGWDWDGQTILSKGSTGETFTIPANSTVTRYKTITLISMYPTFSVAIHYPSKTFLFDWIFSEMTFDHKDSANPIQLCPSK